MRASDIKFLIGKRLPGKYVVFAVDDYGNTRVPAKNSNYRPRTSNRFDFVDTLETRLDLELLFDVLKSVTDQNGNNVVFTPFSLTHNLNIDALLDGEFSVEQLPDTFEKLSIEDPVNYSGAWETLNLGFQEGVFMPEFHGREHFSFDMLNTLWEEFSEFRKEIRVKKGLYDLDHWNNKLNGRWNSAFSYFNGVNIEAYERILDEGVQAFKAIYSTEPTAFTPPGQEFPNELIEYCHSLGLKAIDRPFLTVKSWDKKGNAIGVNWSNKGKDPIIIVRNIVFEPSIEGNLSSVDRVLSEVNKAFIFKRPAIISSHRANFCGAIDIRNRETGLNKLGTLIKKLKFEHPDLHFISYSRLIDIIQGRN